MQAFEKFRLKRAEKMLTLFEEGKEGEILLQRNRSKTLNRLQKHGLIEVDKGRFRITKQGKVALQLGISTYLETLKVKKEVIDFSLEQSTLKGSISLKFLYLLLVFLFVVLYFVIPHPFKLHIRQYSLARIQIYSKAFSTSASF